MIGARLSDQRNSDHAGRFKFTNQRLASRGSSPRFKVHYILIGEFETAEPVVGDEKKLQDFRQLSYDEVRSLVQKSTKKTCNLDPMPTSVVVACLEELFTCNNTHSEFFSCIRTFSIKMEGCSC